VDWPTLISERLAEAVPTALQALGPVALLAARKTALFCSAHTPGDAILRAHDAARRLRDDGATVISGFHSPLEKECLRILLRGKQPIIVCPARAVEGMRIVGGLRQAFEAGRVLFLSPFSGSPRRVTRESAVLRNEIVAALADEAFIAHVTPGGEAERLAEMMRRWGVPITAS
jgi:predicted Rossmann fold nucleotide-binding protein DprA/Smf involved in DNA uptake